METRPAAPNVRYQIQIGVLPNRGVTCIVVEMTAGGENVLWEFDWWWGMWWMVIG